MFCYVYGILSIHNYTGSLINNLDKYFKLKLVSVVDPDIHLVVKLKKNRVENGVWVWTMSPSHYFRDSVKNFEKLLL